ncbi:MAG: glucose 1-dehydrogenase [Pseudomonadota bacterium]
MEQFRLDGKRALITGGSRGIGFGAAEAMAEAGAEVTIVARDPEALDAAAAKIAGAKTLELDIADVAATQAAIAQAGPFDILVNNAGTSRPGFMVDIGPDDFDHVMNLNVRGAYFCAQAVAKGLLAAGKPGSIVNISSQLGHVGSARRTIYCTSKFAVEGMTKAIAVELAPQGIRANTVCPTYIETDLTRPTLTNPEHLSDILARIPMGRIGEVNDVTGAILFLASDAAALITGASLTVDGGWTAV